MKRRNREISQHFNHVIAVVFINSTFRSTSLVVAKVCIAITITQANDSHMSDDPAIISSYGEVYVVVKSRTVQANSAARLHWPECVSKSDTVLNCDRLECSPRR